MKGPDLLELATRNLRESMLRNSLTTLGIGVGVASLVAMLALGVGLQELASSRLSRSGLFDTVVVFSRRDVASFDRAERRRNPSPADTRALDVDARGEMEKLANVIEVYPEIRFPTEIRFDENSHFTTVAGLPPSAKENDAFFGMKGKFLSSAEAEEAILQIDFARSLSDNPDSLLGQELTLRYAERQPLNNATGGNSGAANGDSGEWGFSVVRREKKLRIVGIVENEPFGGMRSFARGRVFIPNALAEQLDTVQASSLRDAIRTPDERRTYNSLLVRVSSPTAVQPVQDAIKKMGFTTWSILDATGRLRQFFVVVDLFLGIFGSVALAVASLGIVNTLVMAILERRREIGIMKAIGASDSDIKRLFFAEAGAMGLVGGALGVAMGWLIGKAINFGTNVYLQRQELPPETIWVSPWWLVAGAILFSILVSLISGLYPAARAAKLDPVQALRYE
jgi:putative ABC transport system permease protein